MVEGTRPFSYITIVARKIGCVKVVVVILDIISDDKEFKNEIYVKARKGKMTTGEGAHPPLITFID